MAKLISWNVNGIRAAIRKGFIDFLDKYDPDIIVEIKAEDFVPIEYLFKIFHFDRIRFSKYSKAVNSFLE